MQSLGNTANATCTVAPTYTLSGLESSKIIGVADDFTDYTQSGFVSEGRIAVGIVGLVANATTSPIT